MSTPHALPVPSLVRGRTAALLLMLCMTASCASPRAEPSAAPPGAGPATALRAALARQCFRNEYPFADPPGQKDVLVLNVDVDGDRATGEYFWLPAFKDRRTGRFDGAVDGDTIDANYRFVQEGRTDETPISIRLSPEAATVDPASAASGLAANIRRVDCPEADP